MNYLAPTRLQDALTALGTGHYSIVAGGTDWYPAQGEAPIQCDMLDITRIQGLRDIQSSSQGWRIGAACTWTDLVKAELPTAFNGLKSAAREVGSIQIQNAATIAGNLCNASPAADGVPALLTLNASVEISSQSQTRTIPLGAFITGPRKIELAGDEMVTALHIPKTSSAAKSAFVKLGARKYLVISIAMVAVVLELNNNALTGVRIAVGACSAVAQRLFALEAALEGASLDDLDDIIAIADISALNPIDDVRGSGDYRLDVASSLIARAIREAAHG